MTVQRASPGRLGLFLALVCLPAPLAAQGYRAEVRLRGGLLELQTLRRDSVAEAEVAGGGLQRTLPDGTLATCVPGDFCRWYTSGEVESVSPLTQELRLAAWPGIEGLSVHAHARSRFGSDDFWPRSDQEVELLAGYASLRRGDFRARAGRMYRTSSLGYYNFDGGSVAWTGLEWLRAEAYGGWSLGRGLNAPRNGDLLTAADEFAPDRRALIFGGEVRLRAPGLLSGSVAWQREIRTDLDALYSERLAADVRLLEAGWSVDGSITYDLAWDEFNDARLRITTPALEGVRLVAQARHYTPFFELWTIWGAFSPVGFQELSGGLVWSGRSLELEGGGAWRTYEDVEAGLSFAPVEDDGWRAYGRARWTRDAWFAEGGYRADESFGAARYGGDARVGRRFGTGRWVALRASTTEQIGEFRIGERFITGGAVEGAWRRGPVSVDGSFGVYRVTFDNRPDAEDWTEPRAHFGISWSFGSDADGGAGYGGDR